MGWRHRDRDIKRELEEIEAKQNALTAEADIILEVEHKILDRLSPRLSYIKLAIGGIMPVGPATLTVGDKKTLSVLGFDQNGAPFAIDFTANPVTYVDDNQAALQDMQGSTVTDPVTALAPGVANVTATCAGFSDQEAYTVVAQAPKLSSIKISID
jgi:hypothetical protein